MGIHDLPEYRDYWSSDTALNVAYVSSKMSPHRYEKLCEYFHCSDPNNVDPEDKLNKVRPLLDVVGELYRRIMSLVQPYLLSYHHLYADNFFSSLELVEHLHEADTYYCGTIRPNRRYFPLRLF